MSVPGSPSCSRGPVYINSHRYSSFSGLPQYHTAASPNYKNEMPAQLRSNGRPASNDAGPPLNQCWATSPRLCHILHTIATNLITCGRFVYIFCLLATGVLTKILSWLPSKNVTNANMMCILIDSLFKPIPNTNMTQVRYWELSYWQVNNKKRRANDIIIHLACNNLM